MVVHSYKELIAYSQGLAGYEHGHALFVNCRGSSASRGDIQRVNQWLQGLPVPSVALGSGGELVTRGFDMLAATEAELATIDADDLHPVVGNRHAFQHYRFLFHARPDRHPRHPENSIRLPLFLSAWLGLPLRNGRAQMGRFAQIPLACPFCVVTPVPRAVSDLSGTTQSLC